MLSDEALYLRVIDGELPAFDTLYKRYEKPLFRFIVHYGFEAAEAEDIFHDAFLSVLRQRSRPKDIQCFRAWIYQVTRHLCLNRKRNMARKSKVILSILNASSEEQSSPDSMLESAEQQHRLKNALAKLPQRLQEIYVMRASGLSYDEVASALKVPVGTVKSRMNELLRSLRKELYELS